MSDKQIFQFRRLPARLDVNQTAELLGFLPHEIPLLVRAGLLKYLGRPAPNAHKYFCAAEIEELSKNRAFLDKATREVGRYVTQKNKKALCPMP